MPPSMYEPKVSRRGLASLQNVRSYQDEHRLVTVWGSWCAAPLGEQAAAWPNISLSHYPDIELTSPYPIILMLTVRLGSDKCQYYKSLV